MKNCHIFIFEMNEIEFSCKNAKNEQDIVTNALCF